MPSERTVIFKVGGSLFSLPDLPTRLRSLFEPTNARILVIPGGGSPADQIREWDRLYHFPAEVSHQLAIDALSLSARFLASLLPESRIALSAEDIQNETSQIIIIDVASVLREMEQQNVEMPPAGWHVTSDSLAGWLATQWAVDELVLVKSVEPPRRIPVGSPDASRNGESFPRHPVDGWFATLIPKLPPVKWCNLRGEDWSLFTYKNGPDGLDLTDSTIRNT